MGFIQHLEQLVPQVAVELLLDIKICIQVYIYNSTRANHSLFVVLSISSPSLFSFLFIGRIDRGSQPRSGFPQSSGGGKTFD